MKRVSLLLLVVSVIFASCSGQEGTKRELKGLEVKAICVALNDFTTTESPTNLNHFMVESTMQNDSYEVVFIPDSPPGSTRGGRTEYGIEIHYVISKETWKITQKSFAR